MTNQPAVNVGDYVVARHTNGDEVRGEVTQANGAGTHWAIRTGEIFAWLDREGWSLELAERPQPPLEDGIYQHRRHRGVRFVRAGLVYDSEGCYPIRPDEWHNRDEYGYVGPEVSR